MFTNTSHIYGLRPCCKEKLKGATIATRAVSKWGGVMIKLSGLSPNTRYNITD